VFYDGRIETHSEYYRHWYWHITSEVWKLLVVENFIQSRSLRSIIFNLWFKEIFLYIFHDLLSCS
jgi:hypothetical protein